MSDLTAKRLKELLHYNPDTGLFTWVKRPSTRGGNTVVGRIAGFIDAQGYRRIRIDGKQYIGSRLAWLYMNGEFPPHQIDHVSQNKSDDRIDNLRAVTIKENSYNRTMNKNNASGQTGVFKVRNKWRSQIKVSYETKYLGEFDSFDDAVAARKYAEKQHGFHPHHGRKL